MILQGLIYLDLRALHIQQICEKSCEIFYINYQVKNLAFKQGGNFFSAGPDLTHVYCCCVWY